MYTFQGLYESSRVLMPKLYQSFLPSSYYELFWSIENGIINLGVALNILLCRVTKHCLQVDKAAHSFIALILGLKAIMQYLFDVKLVKIRALDWSLNVFTFNYSLKSILLGCWGGTKRWSNLFFFLSPVFFQASKLLLLLPCIDHFFFHLFNKAFHLFSGATFL